MKVNSWLAFFILAAIFLSIQATHFSYSISDENTYIYMAKAVSEGQMPYRDFFLAHPPLHIFLLALIYKIFGFSFLIFKATGPLAAIGAALIAFKICREKLGDIEAVFSAFLIFLSYDFQRFSTFTVWITLCTFLVMLSAYFLLKGKSLIGGVLMAAASLAGLFSLIAGFAIAGYLAAFEKKLLMKYLAGFLGVFIACNLALIALFGNSYIEGAYKYHLAKPSEGNDKGDIISFFLLGSLKDGKMSGNHALLIGMGLFLFSRKKMKHALMLPLSIVAAYMLAMALMSKIFGYYFLIIIPFIGILAARGFAGVIERLEGQRAKQAHLICLGLIAVSGMVNSYHYWNNDYQDFNNAEEIAAFVKESYPEKEIFGDDSITPLIALLSGNKLAFNYIDSNSLRWRSGLLDINETISRIRQGRIIVIERRLNDGKGSFRYGPAFIDEFSSFLVKECAVKKKWSEPWGKYQKEYYVHECPK